VVNLGGGDVLTRCVEFSEPEIGGYQVLERSGLQVVRRAEGMGGIVCSIEGVGCPVDNCFCQCSGSTCTYWSYWHFAGEQWSYSVIGADAHRVRDGDMEGWNWGEEEPPPVISYDQICAPPATATPVPTSTPVPPTHTPLPPPSVRFAVSPPTIVAGECAELIWNVEYVRAVYLNGEGVAGQASRAVCPTQSTTYELRVVAAGSESLHPLTLSVVQPTATSTNTPLPVPTSTTAPSLQPAATATREPTMTPTETMTANAESFVTLAPTTLPAETPTSFPTVTATETAVPTATPTTAPTTAPTATPTPRPVAQLVRPSPTPSGVAADRPSPTPNAGLEQPGSGWAGEGEAANYVLFGVLMTVLVGVGATILIQRRR
jgi:hypothetical protein